MNRWPLIERFPVPEDLQTDLLASMTGSPPDFVRATIAAMTAAVQRDASELMADADFHAAVEAIPLSPGDRLIAIGDSVTADRRGWFELLKASIKLALPTGVEVVNLGLSGDTTADVLERLDVLENARPTWVLVMLGTNDTRYHGSKQAYRMVGLAETERNIRALMECVTGDLAADATLITPPPADQERISSFFQGAAVTWRADELDAVAALIRSLDSDCVDVSQSIRASALSGLLEADGVHPTVSGQRHIVRFVAKRLAHFRRSGIARLGDTAQRHQVPTEAGA